MKESEIATIREEIDRNAEDFRLRFNELLDAETDKNGIGQHELAGSLGVSQGSISKNLNGINRPGFDLLSALASFFGVSTDYLFGRIDVRNPDINDMATAKKYGLGEHALESLKTWNGFYDYPVTGPTPHDCELALHGANLLFETMPTEFFISLSRYYEHYFDKPLPYETDSELYDDYQLTPDILDSSLLLRIQNFFIEARDRNDKYREQYALDKVKRQNRGKKKTKKEEN